jgi:hypothetical protein
VANKSALHVRDTFVKRYHCKPTYILDSCYAPSDSGTSTCQSRPSRFFRWSLTIACMSSLALRFYFPDLRILSPLHKAVPVPQRSAVPGSTLLSRLFHRNPYDVHETSPSSPLDWARNLLKRHRQNGEGIELQGCKPAVVEVPYAKGKRVCILSSTAKRRLISRRETLQRGKLH